MNCAFNPPTLRFVVAHRLICVSSSRHRSSSSRRRSSRSRCSLPSWGAGIISSVLRVSLHCHHDGAVLPSRRIQYRRRCTSRRTLFRTSSFAPRPIIVRLQGLLLSRFPSLFLHGDTAGPSLTVVAGWSPRRITHEESRQKKPHAQRNIPRDFGVESCEARGADVYARSSYIGCGREGFE